MTATAATLETTLATVEDFPDRLSPLLVKELRRALRSVFFVWPFVALPAALGLTGVWVMMQEGEPLAHRALSTVLWYGVVVPCFILKPVQALLAIRQERANRTLDLLLLTGLSPMRIVTGKWLSLEVQSLLFLVSLLPFFLLRYFFGQVELLNIALALLATMLAAAFVTVLCLAISTLGRVAFGLCTAGMVIFAPLWLLPTGFLSMAITGTSGLSLPWVLLPPLVLVALVATGIGFVALSIAGANVAPLPTSPYQRGMRTRHLVPPALPPSTSS